MVSSHVLFHRVQFRMISVVIFRILFCFVVAICDLVHDVETIFHLSYVRTAYGNYSFTGITHTSEKKIQML